MRKVREIDEFGIFKNYRLVFQRKLAYISADHHENLNYKVKAICDRREGVWVFKWRIMPLKLVFSDLTLQIFSGLVVISDFNTNAVFALQCSASFTSYYVGKGPVTPIPSATASFTLG